MICIPESIVVCLIDTMGGLDLKDRLELVNALINNVLSTFLLHKIKIS